MTTGTDIDVLYDRFCSTVPTDVRGLARSLAYELKLAPDPAIPWSAVFKHRMTLQAPALLLAGTVGVDARAMENAVLAHMLAVIEAFGTDRIADEQVTDTPGLRRVLALARKARDDGLSAIGGAEARRMAEEADTRTRDAIAVERRLLALGNAIDFATYERVSAGKQSVGLPASMVLARAVGFDAPKLELVETALMGVWLGLQFQDDVVDWEDDVTRGGAWAVLLARRAQPKASAASNVDHPKRLVVSTGVLSEMLALSVSRFRSALVSAESLGAAELTEWLRARSREALELWEGERKSPGYVRRLKQLAPWAAEVLA